MAYRAETVVAEKLHAIVHLGVANTRLKDFYDLVALSRACSFEAAMLRRAIEATFLRRGTDLPKSVPPGLTVAYAAPDVRRQWTAFLERSELEVRLELEDALEVIRAFVGPVVWDWDDGGGDKRWVRGEEWLE